MPEQFNFTKKDIEKLPTPSGTAKQVLYRDSKTTGLCVSVTKTGSKSFVYYRKAPAAPGEIPTPVKRKLGAFPDMTVEQARVLSNEANARVSRNVPPFTDMGRPEAITFGELFRSYISEHAKRKTKTWEETEKSYVRYFAETWENKFADKIKRQDITDWVLKLGDESGHATANRNLDTFKAVVNWGLNNDRVSYERNPCLGVKPFEKKARERFLKQSEFEAFTKAVQEEPSETMRDFFWVSLFTGARRSNVLAMEWSQIDFDLGSWHIPVTKNGDSLVVPLTINALEILNKRKESNEHPRWVFPSDRKGRVTKVIGHIAPPKDAWKRLLKRAGIEDLRIHDLRRTAGSYMAIQNVSPTIIGNALGHRPGSKATAIYSRLSKDPVKQAMENAQAMLPKPPELKVITTVVDLQKKKSGSAQ